MWRAASKWFCLIVFLFFSVSCARISPAVKTTPPSFIIPELPSQFVEIDGAKIHYFEMGEGKPLILMHGMMGSSLSWFQNIPDFAKRYHVIALDFPGLGESELGNFHSNVKEYTRFLKLFLEEKKIKKPTLIGISLGAHVALNYTFTAPEEVDKLVLISPTGISKPIHVIEEIPWILLWHQPILRWHLSEEKIKQLWHRQYQYSFTVRDALYQKRTQLRDPEKLKKYLRLFQTCVYDLKHYSLRWRLDQIEKPTLILWGKQSKYHPHREGEFLKQKIKNSKLVLFPSGPPVNVDMPEEFNRVVRDFLNEEEKQIL